MERVHLHTDGEEGLGDTATARTGSRWPYREYWSLMLVCLCVGLVIVALILGSYGVSKSNQIQAQIQSEMSLRQEIAQHDAESLPFATRSIALSGVYRSGKPRVLSLCTLASYHAPSNGTTTLVPLQDETISEISEGSLRTHRFYHLNVHLRLTFAELTKKKKLKTTGVMSESRKKAILLEYNLTSNYVDFSTIKLEELEFDTRSASLHALRTIVLCSNSPYAVAHRCNEAQTKTALVIRGEEELSFDIPRLLTPPSREEEEEEEEDEEENEILGIRMYNLVFYRMVTQNASRAIYEETRLMTLEPSKC